MLVDYDQIDYNDKKTWDLICKGYTKGCFQIQSFLGRDWCKKIRPRNIEELSALVSLIRPGCLEVIIDGKSVPQHYADRKNGEEPVTYFHPALEPILNKTYGLLIYQEQSIKIVQELAGFSPSKADELRRGIGKKKPEIIAALKTEFINGAKEKGIVTEDEAAEIFSWIEKSQRYSFNACLSPETLVETKNGYKTLDEINIGEEVNSPYGFIEVVNKFDNGPKEVYEITLESGKTIECTLDHQFLCSDNQKYPLWQILEENLLITCEDD